MVVYYVVHKGKIPGIYTSWDKCKIQVNKFENAIFKKFTDKEEAEKFLKEGFGLGKKPKIITRRINDDLKNNNKIEDETDNDDGLDKVFIYTDGSCIRFKNNICKAGYGIYIPNNDIKVSCPLLNQKITNNRAELTAIIECIKYLDDDDLTKKLCIFTDSQYSIYIFNGTGERYESNGYKNNGTDVPNIDLIKKILELKRKYNIVLLKVRSHTDKKDIHSKGNKIADELANDGALEQDNKNSIFKNNIDNIFDNSDNIFGKNDNIFDDDIDKNIKMNELFEFKESNNEVPQIIYGKNNKPLKNPKLSNWFQKI